MIKIKQSILLFTLLTFSNITNAGIWIEPYIGWHMTGDFNSSGTATLTTAYLNGNGYGGRLGYEAFGLLIGLQQEMGSISSYLNGPQATKDLYVSYHLPQKESYGVNRTGLFLGYKFIDELRVWGTYFWKSKIVGQEFYDTAQYSYETNTYLGSGLAFGLGYEPIPFLSFNIEYRSMTYNEYFSRTSGKNQALPDTGNDIGEVEENSVMLSFSVPVNI